MPVLYVKDENGNFVEIPALKGNPGKTPVRGVDYWTEEDREQIVGEVLGEVGDGEWELIEAITVNESGISIIKRDINYKRFRAYIQFKPATTANSVGIEAYDNGKMFGYAWVGNAINTTDRYMYVEIVNNEIEAYMINTAVSANKNTSVTMNRTPTTAKGETLVTRFSIYGASGAEIPVGSTIELWGVRANA